MPYIECSICSEQFGNGDSSDVIVTPCGHVFHEHCLSKWLQHSKINMPKTCPECRQPVTMQYTRRIYFNLSTVTDNTYAYMEYLNTEIASKSNKLHLVTLQNEQIKLECANKLREKDYEIQRLNEKLKHRGPDYEAQKQNAKIEKLKHKLKELQHKLSSIEKMQSKGVMGDQREKLTDWESNMRIIYSKEFDQNIGRSNNAQPPKQLTAVDTTRMTNATVVNDSMMNLPETTMGNVIRNDQYGEIGQQSTAWADSNFYGANSTAATTSTHSLLQHIMNTGLYQRQHGSFSAYPQGYQVPSTQNSLISNTFMPTPFMGSSSNSTSQNVNHQFPCLNVAMNLTSNASYANSSNTYTYSQFP